MISGTSPQDVVSISGVVPDPNSVSDPSRAAAMKRSLAYMGLTPGQKLEGLQVDKVFIGSCTNARIEDIREAAAVAKGKKVAKHIVAMVVPGSGLVKAQAESEGLDVILIAAGFEWREPGCSMCLAMNPDKLEPQERCASTSNRNFEGRQGSGGRTHLVSPAMAAAAAISGGLTDIRKVSISKINIPNDDMFQKILDSMNAYSSSKGKAPQTAAKKKVTVTNTFEVKASDPTKVFNRLVGVAAPLDIQNIDTDMII